MEQAFFLLVMILLNEKTVVDLRVDWVLLLRVGNAYLILYWLGMEDG